MVASIATLFTVAIVLHRERGWRWPFAVASAILLISLYSRLYLGVHWPTDVIAGLVMGVVWLGATLAAFPPHRG
jgi:undecaprenyl-diphosphatase